MPRHQSAIHSRHSALTLVELLVVITILTTLVAAAIPLMAPGTGQRRLREGARQLNTMITGARARAIALGRPVGIWLEKVSADQLRSNPSLAPSDVVENRGAVANVYFCEEPEPFRGFAPDSAVILRQLSGGGIWVAKFIDNDGTIPSPEDMIPSGIVRPGDRLVVAGISFELVGGGTALEQSGANTGYFKQTATLTCRQLQSKKWNESFQHQGNSWTYPAPYRFDRIPRKSAADSLQLPAGVVVDLEASGDSPQRGGPYFNGFYHDPLRPYPLTQHRPNNNDEPVIIMFGPDGSISRVYRNAGLPFAGTPPVDLPVSYTPSSPIHLLIAQRENVNESINVPDNNDVAELFDPEKNQTNWFNPNSLWISISPRTGRVATNPNIPVDDTQFNPANEALYDSTWPLKYRALVYQRHAAREFTRSNFNLGGR